MRDLSTDPVLDRDLTVSPGFGHVPAPQIRDAVRTLVEEHKLIPNAKGLRGLDASVFTYLHTSVTARRMACGKLS